MSEFKLNKIDVCPHAASCNANICPLDPDYLNRSHNKGESVCRFLKAEAKHALDGKKRR